MTHDSNPQHDHSAGIEGCSDCMETAKKITADGGDGCNQYLEHLIKQDFGEKTARAAERMAEYLGAKDLGKTVAMALMIRDQLSDILRDLRFLLESDMHPDADLIDLIISLGLDPEDLMGLVESGVIGVEVVAVDPNRPNEN